jgi:hypothetical protein
MIPLSRSLHFSVYIVHSIDSGLEIFTAGRWLDHKRRQKKIRQRGKQGMASMVPMDKSKRQAESKGQSKPYHHLQFLLLGSLLQVRGRLHHTAIHGLLSRLLQSFFSRSRVNWGNTDSLLTPALRTLSWVNVQGTVEGRFEPQSPVFRQLRPTGDWPNTTGSDRWYLQCCPFERPQVCRAC